jgi:hypothetical protein
MKALEYFVLIWIANLITVYLTLTIASNFTNISGLGFVFFFYISTPAFLLLAIVNSPKKITYSFRQSPDLFFVQAVELLSLFLLPVVPAIPIVTFIFYFLIMLASSSETD